MLVKASKLRVDQSKSIDTIWCNVCFSAVTVHSTYFILFSTYIRMYLRTLYVYCMYFIRILYICT